VWRVQTHHSRAIKGLARFGMDTTTVTRVLRRMLLKVTERSA
jgi:hypothetical protein